MSFPAFETYVAATGLTIAAVTAEEQNSDYESGVAEIDGARWHIRTARTTPAKPGAFTAFWCRGADGQTAPFAADAVGAGLLVLVEQGSLRGRFRFTAQELATLGITSGRRPGKRGFRVYPAWCTDLNPQASRAQRAQSSAFAEY